jgi:lysophospholipase L1-like esterase
MKSAPINKRRLLKTAALTTAIVCAPFLITQGIYIGWRTPLLADASGPMRGVIQGAGKPLRVLIVGESSVAGVGAETHAEALTGQFAAGLHARTGRTVEWKAIARSGATLKIANHEIIPQLVEMCCGQTDDSADDTTTPDLVLIAIGANDIIRLEREQRWLSQLEQFIAAVRHVVGDVPIILSAPPRYNHVRAFPRPLRSTFYLFGRMLYHAAERWSADDARFLVLLPDIDIDDSLLACDQFHLNPRGYRLWAEWLAAEITPHIHDNIYDDLR